MLYSLSVTAQRTDPSPLFFSFAHIYLISRAMGVCKLCSLSVCSQRHNLRVCYIDLTSSSLQPWKAPCYILLCLLTSQIFSLLWKFFSHFLSFVPKNLELFTEIGGFPYWKRIKRNNHLSGLSQGTVTSHRLITPWTGNDMKFWDHV